MYMSLCRYPQLKGRQTTEFCPEELQYTLKMDARKHLKPDRLSIVTDETMFSRLVKNPATGGENVVHN
jgi:hypothetical protein